MTYGTCRTHYHMDNTGRMEATGGKEKVNPGG
jgi:hypothetical protein